MTRRSRSSSTPTRARTAPRASSSASTARTDRVAQTMRRDFPEDFEMLSTYGYNLGRRIEHYMTGMQIQIQDEPIFQLDAKGNLVSVRYHELYRSAFTLPFDVFPKYYKALGKFYELVH